ncbi:MAG: sulfotransferase [Gemmatimonadales bacterium]
MNDGHAGGDRVRYVCMPGSPFTGSTLLGALLNEHAECASIGAATGLIRRTDLSTYRCACGRLFRECEFWNRVAVRTRALGHPVDVFKTGFWNTHLRLSSNRLANVALARSLRWSPLNEVRDAVVGVLPGARASISKSGWNTWSLATAVLEQTGKSVFVDTARDHQRPKYLAKHERLDVRVIHLIRDPRGNSASIMKHAGVDVAAAARQWRHYNVEADRVRRYLPPESWMTLHYEDLCADPAGTLDRISDFLQVSRAPTRPQAQSPERHIIGNSMRLRALSEIREDRSWETRLGQAELDVIARIAGPASRDLGGNWP